MGIQDETGTSELRKRLQYQERAKFRNAASNDQRDAPLSAKRRDPKRGAHWTVTLMMWALPSSSCSSS
jgi:hypothetical protein